MTHRIKLATGEVYEIRFSYTGKDAKHGPMEGNFSVLLRADDSVAAVDRASDRVVRAIENGRLLDNLSEFQLHIECVIKISNALKGPVIIEFEERSQRQGWSVENSFPLAVGKGVDIADWVSDDSKLDPQIDPTLFWDAEPADLVKRPKNRKITSLWSQRDTEPVEKAPELKTER